MANRDEFISIVNTLISLSKSITDDQYKSLLQQAVQEYDLTLDDASEILTTYGLVVGESVNYFEVLGLSIEELTHQDETEIASHIEIAHKRHYTESLQAGGLPRSDGRTQEQWRTLLNDAFYTLIDSQKRTEYIDSLTKNRSQDEGQENIGDDPKSEEQVITTQKSTSISFSVPENMNHITSGEFQMGNQNENANDREIPVHSVFVDEFYMDKYPVTNAQYKRFVDANPVWSKPASSLVWHRKNKRIITGRMTRQDYLKNWNGNTFPQEMEDHPVTYINWYAAMAYAKWIGKRLPTEAEWEKAARGGIIGQNYPWGNTLDADRANCNNTIGETTSVGKFPPNNYGLYDMVGNVWEWCLDEYQTDYYSHSPNENPIAGYDTKEKLYALCSYYGNVDTERVLRGGTLFYSSEPINIHVRWGGDPSLTNYYSSDSSKIVAQYSSGLMVNIGFRCVWDVNMQKQSK